MSLNLAGKIVELRERGYCVLESHLDRSPLEACREAFERVLSQYLATHCDAPNRGPRRHFLPMPFDPPSFAPEFFFDEAVLNIVRSALGDRLVADQWGCDVPLDGSKYQEAHADYKRPLFEELPDLSLPPYLLVVSFGLTPIGLDDGPIEIAAGTHLMPRAEALHRIGRHEIPLEPVPLKLGDVLIRHPWALHRGTPNRIGKPRLLCTIRYARRWYWDASREVNAIPRAVWQSLEPEQRELLRFPVV